MNDTLEAKWRIFALFSCSFSIFLASIHRHTSSLGNWYHRDPLAEMRLFFFFTPFFFNPISSVFSKPRSLRLFIHDFFVPPWLSFSPFSFLLFSDPPPSIIHSTGSFLFLWLFFCSGPAAWIGTIHNIFTYEPVPTILFSIFQSSARYTWKKKEEKKPFYRDVSFHNPFLFTSVPLPVGRATSICQSRGFHV